jgi:hypothetical protein
LVLVATSSPAKVVANVNVLKYKFIFLPPFMLDSAFIQADPPWASLPSNQHIGIFVDAKANRTLTGRDRWRNPTKASAPPFWPNQT